MDTNGQHSFIECDHWRAAFLMGVDQCSLVVSFGS
jgi:hypothetical protein